MKEAAGVSSVGALSKSLGYKSNAIQNTISRGNVPYKEAAMLARAKGVSLDWLIFGRDSAHSLENPERESANAADSYHRATRNPAVADETDPDWAAYNRRAQDVLRQVVEGVETALNELKLTLPPGKKSELVTLLFEMYASAQAPPNRNHILRLVRSAS